MDAGGSGLQPEKLGCQVIRGAVSGRCESELAGLGLECRNELFTLFRAE